MGTMDDAPNAIASKTALDSVLQCTEPSVAADDGQDLVMLGAHKSVTVTAIATSARQYRAHSQ